MKKPNQAIQYDSGKYYCIEDMSIFPDAILSSVKCKSLLKSTRIEVAPESEDDAKGLIVKQTQRNVFTKTGDLITDIVEGIFPVQVKVEIVNADPFECSEYNCTCIKSRDIPDSDICSFPKQYAILSEPDICIQTGKPCGMPCYEKCPVSERIFNGSVTVSGGFEPKTLYTETTKPCAHCGGSGYDSCPNNSTSYPVCPACHGNKDTKKASRIGDYVLRLESACNEKTLTAREKIRIIKALLAEFKTITPQ